MVNPVKPLDKTEAKKDKKPRMKKVKIYIIFLLVIGICFLLTSAITLFLWYGGHIQKVLCQVVEPDSMIAEKIECTKKNDSSQNTVVEEGDGEYKVNVLEDEKIVVSELEQIVIDVVDNSTPAVVGIGIKAEGGGSDRVIGTGFVVTANGLIVTNSHVVSSGTADDYFVVLHGNSDRLSVNKINRDEVNDIAILEIGGTGLPTLPLGNSDDIKVGQTVIAIGNPLGSLSSTVTVGSVSGLNRDVNVGGDFFNLTSSAYSDVIQTDAAINPGNSGGPLINSRGEVIGVNFATIEGADNLSFALPINIVRDRIDELNEFNSFRIPFVGIEFRRRVTFVESEAVVGAQVLEIVKGTPADTSELELGDIIIEFAGKNVEDNSLVQLIQKQGIGDNVEMKVLRDGEIIELKLEIGNRSDFE